MSLSPNMKTIIIMQPNLLSHAQHSPTPWRITEPHEKKGAREIVDANGTTVAKLTSLDIPNAELIVTSVNSYYSKSKQRRASDVDVEFITDVSKLKAGSGYWLLHKQTKEATLRYCGNRDGQLYFDSHIWAMPDNNQAMDRWDIFGPVPPIETLAPDFEALKKEAGIK